ncbi:hypothetical protein EB232_16630 [Mesorhizobium sp. NZP2077]|nr:hypothetical protein EB232_16630 [Mesorhizobium sp. NZP2077]
MLRKFLTDWTNVSTALSAVKGLLAEMRLLKCVPQAREKLVQRIGPDDLEREIWQHEGSQR